MNNTNSSQNTFYENTIEPTLFDEFVALPHAEGREKTEARASENYKKTHPCRSNSQSLEEAETEVEYAKQMRDSLRKKSAQTRPYVKVRQNNSNAKTDLINIGMGWTFLLVMTGCLFVIPTLAASLMYESGTLTLTENTPALGAIFGLAAMVGVAGSIAYRDTIDTDSGEKRHDKRIFTLGVCIYLIWIAAFALVNYPIAFGETIQTDVMGNKTVESTFILSLPKAVMLIITAALDVTAGAVMHVFVCSRLTPRVLKVIIPDAEKKHLDNELIPDIESLVQRSQATLTKLEEELADWLRDHNRYVSACLHVYEKRYAEFSLLQAQAIAAFHDIPIGLPATFERADNIAPPQPQPNGHARF